MDTDKETIINAQNEAGTLYVAWLTMTEDIANEINEGKIKLNTLEIEEKGENIAVKEMRKHISAYTKSMPDSSSFRSKINTMDTAEEVRKCLKEYFAQ